MTKIVVSAEAYPFAYTFAADLYAVDEGALHLYLDDGSDVASFAPGQWQRVTVEYTDPPLDLSGIEDEVLSGELMSRGYDVLDAQTHAIEQGAGAEFRRDLALKAYARICGDVYNALFK